MSTQTAWEQPVRGPSEQPLGEACFRLAARPAPGPGTSGWQTCVHLRSTSGACRLLGLAESARGPSARGVAATNEVHSSVS